MILPLLQRELSIDDFVDRDQECRLATLLADPNSADQEQRLYTKEVASLVHQAMVTLDTTTPSTRAWTTSLDGPTGATTVVV